MAEEKKDKVASLVEKKKEEQEKALAELQELQDDLVDSFKFDAHVRWEYYKALRKEGFDREQAMELVRDMQLLEDEE